MASTHEVMTGSISGVKICSNYQQKAVMQVLSVIDLSTEPHLLPVLVKMNFFRKTSQPWLRGNPCQ